MRDGSEVDVQEMATKAAAHSSSNSKCERDMIDPISPHYFYFYSTDSASHNAPNGAALSLSRPRTLTPCTPTTKAEPKKRLHSDIDQAMVLLMSLGEEGRRVSAAKTRKPETPKHRKPETPKTRNTETPKHRNTKTPKHRNTETPKHRNSEIAK